MSLMRKLPVNGGAATNSFRTELGGECRSISAAPAEAED
jgi:hypothetical protein